MRYLRTYEEFKFNEVETQVEEPEVELSDTTIDDVLSDDFLKDMEDKEDLDLDKEESSYKDNKGVYHIKNWNVY